MSLPYAIGILLLIWGGKHVIDKYVSDSFRYYSNFAYYVAAVLWQATLAWERCYKFNNKFRRWMAARPNDP